MTTTTKPYRRNITPSVWKSIIQQGACHYCGYANPEVLEVDHVIPVSRGGSDKKKNLVPACWRCNHEKRDLTPDEWASKREIAGAPWPVPNPVDTVKKIVERLPKDVLGVHFDGEIRSYVYAMVMRGREAGFDPQVEADEFARLLRGGDRA